MTVELTPDTLDSAPVYAEQPAYDPEFERVKAVLESRLLGRTQVSSRIGRFVVLERVGAGGMGVVYSAFDPQLDRKVAIKLLFEGESDERERGRLLGEAKALAKLAHPNVVAVYEVGEHLGRVFVAMEYVRGRTLKQWLEQTPRSWREKLSMCTQAGRGLAAAHAAGIVHRDFKPDNVLVGEDDRVRVVDFGLARRASQDISESRPADPDDRRADATLTRLTRTGALLGTPAYMSPEQMRGDSVDAHADQFGFCVTTWEALAGERPFVGTSVQSLFEQVTEGAPRSAPRAAIPRWIEAVLRRGLSPREEHRYASMDALLAALERGQRRARWRHVGLGAASVGLAGLAIVSVRQIDLRNRIAACEDAGATIDGTWNEDARRALHDAHVATGVSYGADTAARVVPWLDRYASTWRDVRVEGCLATEVRGDWNAETYLRSQWCLDERWMRFDALLAKLQQVRADEVRGSVGAASNLGNVEPCIDVAVLGRLPGPPTDRRDEIRAALSELLHTRLDDYERSEDALRAIRGVIDRASELDWPPLAAEAHWREGDVLENRGEYEQAVQAFELAYFVAADAGAWDVAAESATRLVFTIGARLGRHDQGLSWGRHAALAQTQAGDPEGSRESTRLQLLATVHQAMGDHANAKAMNEAALAIKERLFGPDHPAIAPILGNLSGTYYAAGDYAGAQALVQRMLAINENALGPDHPDVAQSLEALALISLEVGEAARARTLLERVLVVTETSLGTAHQRTGFVLINLATAQRTLGDAQGALASCERALSILEAAMGREHLDVAHVLVTKANTLVDLQRYDEALPLYRRALAIREHALPTDHPEIAKTLNNLAHALIGRGQHAEARPLLERSLALEEKQLGAEHPSVAWTLSELATVEVETGTPSVALALAERAVAIHEKVPGETPEELDSRFVLAQALARAGEPARARIEAERAIAGNRGAGPGREDELAEVEQWLARLTP